LALAETADRVEAQLRSPQRGLYSKVLVCVRGEAFFQVLLGACLSSLSPVDIDLLNIFTHISKHSDQLRADFKDTACDREDGLLTAVACSQNTYPQGG
jgi:hypothetical protein